MGKNLNNYNSKSNKVDDESDDEKSKIILDTYYSLDSSAAYAGLQRVWQEAKKRDPTITEDDVKHVLQREHTYTMYAPARKRFPRLKTTASGLHVDWQCDLAVFDSIKKQNDGYAYLLVCIDVLSRKIIVAPCKKKSPQEVIPAFEKVFEKNEGIKPHKIHTDSGKEFVANVMQEFFRQNLIKHYVVYSPYIHAAMVERANRTIKERLYRYFSRKNTTRWIDVIDRLVDGINSSINRSTGVQPNAVTFQNAERLRQKLINNDVNIKNTNSPAHLYKGGNNNDNDNKRNKEKGTAKFKVGDIVRIAKHKRTFEKSYLANYTDQLFRIREVNNGSVIHKSRKKQQQRPFIYYYRLEELESGEPILGVFYTEELQRAVENTTHRIAEILKTRIGRGGKKEHFVSWVGYSSKHNSWIKESDIV